MANVIAKIISVGGTLEVRASCPYCICWQVEEMDIRSIDMVGVICDDCGQVFDIINPFARSVAEHNQSASLGLNPEEQAPTPQGAGHPVS
jgi:hypothetical protein